MQPGTFSLTITAEDIRKQGERRAELLAEVAKIDQWLHHVRSLMPPEVALQLPGLPGRADPIRSANQPRKTAREKPFAKRAVTDLVLWRLEGEGGGRAPGWIRRSLEALPELHDRLTASPTSVSNAVARLVERKKLIKEDGLYYLPDLFERIKKGETEDERLENDGAPSFNSVMHAVMMAHGKPFVAAEAIAIAESHEVLGPQIKQKANRVYSWLSREVFKHKLAKDGEYYFYPSQRDGAPNGQAAGAPSAGRAATLPFENVVGFPQSR